MPMLVIACSAHNKDMMVASLQPEVDKVVAWSDKGRLTLNTSKRGQPSSAWTVQKRPGKPTSPVMENECSAIPSRFSWVSDKTGSTPLERMCESSANRCPAAPTSSVLWEAQLSSDQHRDRA